MDCCPHHELHEECLNGSHDKCVKRYEAFGHRNYCGCTCHDLAARDAARAAAGDVRGDR